MTIFWAMLLVLLLLAGWMMTLVGMPGNWLMVVAASVYALLVPADSPLAIGWIVVFILLGLALLGELLEFLAGALGAVHGGGSRRGAVLALAGSVLGSLVGLAVGLPVPLIGPLVAAVLFGGLGALVGAMIGETWKGRKLGESWRIGQAAFWGRLLGTLAKTVVGSVMVVVTIVALVF